jgi:predicted aspartyl protease
MKTVECGFSGPLAGNRLTGDGPSILVDIGFDPAWRAGKIPASTDRDIVALIDTGAQECFIDCDLAGYLRLPMVDRREVAGSLGKHEVDVYLAQIYIPTLDFIQYGKFAGAYLNRGGLQYGILMGRTFLEKFVLVYDGRSGRVTLTG